jgi:hypothetical protein
MKTNYFKADTNNNIFAKEWALIESKRAVPAVFRKLIHIEYNEFVSKILEKNPQFIKNIIENLYSGDMYIIKNSLTKDRVDHIVNEIHKFTQSSPSKFYKMLEGIPNFHRWIGKDLINAYSIKYTKHSTHIFPWNEDISDVRKIVMEVCRPIKYLAGLSYDEFKNNTPKDMVIERLQIARYPPTGYIETHVDANTLLRLVISGYLTTKGIHYKKGGFYLVDENDKKFDIEDQIQAGDIGLFYASVRHGLDVIDPEKEADIKKKDGRWWFGLNVHNSDEMESSKRRTTSPYKIGQSV